MPFPAASGHRSGAPYRRAARVCAGALALCALSLAAPDAPAAPALRVQTVQHGNFAIIGNTLAQACETGVPAPVVGTVGACGNNTTDSAPDVYWRADSPASGQAQANNTITQAQARSTAVLALPDGARVTHAYLYWAATNASAVADTTAMLDRPGAGGFSQNLNALQSYTSSNNAYESVADVTALVAESGSGAYRVGGVDSANLVDLNSNNVFTGWWMVVLYEYDSDPLRSLTLYDGLDVISNGSPQSTTLGGFRLPLSGYSAQLGVVALEGDVSLTGDQFFFNGGAALGDAQNPVNNFFNGTHSSNGSPVSTAGDLPQTTGTAGSLSGLDIDTLDVTNKVSGGQTSASIQASSAGDTYFLASMVVAFTTFRPNFGNSVMSVTDLNGGAVVPGDVLEYTIAVNNDGNDDSTGTTLDDVLPAGLSYVPHSLEFTSGANAGPKSDAPGDDQAEYIGAERRIAMRLGTGANGTQGGTVPVSAQTTVRFRASVDAVGCTAHASIANQATIRGVGALSLDAIEIGSDADAATPGQQAAAVAIDLDCLELTLPPSPAHGVVQSDFLSFSCPADTCSASVPTGTVVNLTAVPDAGYLFAGWGGDCSAAGTATTLALTMDAAKSCAASFAAAPHAVAISVGGLLGSGLSATLNGGETLALTANGTFAFATPVAFGELYDVAIATQPGAPAQVCTFGPGVPASGTMPDADITLGLTCAAPSYTVSGTVGGLVGTDLVLALNGSSNVLVTANGGFTFPQGLPDQTAYTVTVAQAPIQPAQVCAVTHGSGTIAGANVTGVQVACAAPQPHLSVTVTDDHAYARYGMIVSYVVTLTNDGAADASGIAISAGAQQLEAAGTTWSCLGAGSGAACTSAGTGALADSGVVLPIGRSLTWLVAAPLREDAAGDTLDYAVNVTGAGGASASASDSDVLVLLRTGTDVPYGDGAE